MIREAIKTIVESGGTVKFSYKREHDDYMGDAAIHILRVTDKAGQIVVQSPEVYDYYEDIDVAIDSYCDLVFARENMGLGIRGIIKHRMTNKDLEEIREREMKRLVNQYYDTYFKKDYPEFS